MSFLTIFWGRLSHKRNKRLSFRYPKKQTSVCLRPIVILRKFSVKKHGKGADTCGASYYEVL